MKLTRTCVACPTQFDLDDLPMGMYGYFRFRNATWRIDIAQSRAHWWQHNLLATTSAQFGAEPNGGYMSYHEVDSVLDEYLPELLEQALTALSQQSNVLLSTTTDKDETCTHSPLQM